MHVRMQSCTYAIMKTMYPPGYHHNGFLTTHAPGHMIYGLTFITERAHCFYDCIFITPTLSLLDLLDLVDHLYIFDVITYPLHSCDYLKQNFN